jgi:Domain of unknown function (DUF5753)/Helix-turn-helix domain
VTPRNTIAGKLATALLRHHRETSRLLIEEAADALGCDRSKISRMENGLRGIRPGELLSLLGAYRVTAQEREAVAALYQAARSGWWDGYRGLLPGAMVDRAVLESVGGDLMVYEPQVVPAFLQTRRYAEAVALADPALRTGEERDLAAGLSARRAEVLRDAPPAGFTVVLGEAALVQEVCGGEEMLEQLRRLAGEDGDVPAGVVRVIPFAAGAHPGLSTGPVSVTRFRGVSGVGAVCQGWSDSGVSVVRQEELTAAVRRLDALRDAALSAEASLQLIRRLIRNWN